MNTESNSAESLHKKVKHGWLWGAIEQFAQRGLSLVVSVALARLLDPTAFGLIASIAIFLDLAQQLIDGGIGSRIMQKSDITEDDFTAFFWCNGIISILSCVLLVSFSNSIAGFYGNQQLRSIVIVMSIVLVLMNAGRTQQMRLMRDFRFKIISLVTITSVLAGSVAGLSLAFAGFGVWAILGQQFVMSLVRALAFWWMVPWRPTGLPEWNAVKDLYAFGAPIMISQSIQGFSVQLINILTGRYVGMASLGYYDRGRFIPVNAAGFLQSIFFRTNMPLLGKLQHKAAEFKKAYLHTLNSIASNCLMVMAGMIVCAPEIIEVILGEKWLPSVWFLRMGCIMSTLYMFYLINQDVLKAKGAIRSFFTQNIIYTVLQSAGVFIGLIWGIHGMVFGSILAGGLSCVAIMVAVHRASTISTRSQLRSLFFPFLKMLAVACSLGLIRQLEMPVMGRFVLCGGAGLGLFLLLSWQSKSRAKA